MIDDEEEFLPAGHAAVVLRVGKAGSNGLTQVRLNTFGDDRADELRIIMAAWLGFTANIAERQDVSKKFRQLAQNVIEAAETPRGAQ